MSTAEPPPPTPSKHLATRALGMVVPIAAFVVYGLVAASRETEGGTSETWLGVALWAFMVFLVWAMLMGAEAALLHSTGDVQRRNANLVGTGVSFLVLLILLAPLLL